MNPPSAYPHVQQDALAAACNAVVNNPRQQPVSETEEDASLRHESPGELIPLDNSTTRRSPKKVVPPGFHEPKLLGDFANQFGTNGPIRRMAQSAEDKKSAQPNETVADKTARPFDFDLSTSQRVRTDRWNVIDSLMHDIDQHSVNSTYVFKTDEDDVVARSIGQFVDDLQRSVSRESKQESAGASLYDRVMEQVRMFKDRPYDALHVSALLSQHGRHATISFHLFAKRP